MAEQLDFKDFEVPELKKYLTDRGITCKIENKYVLVRFCELAEELDLGDLDMIKRKGKEVSVSYNDGSCTVKVGNETISKLVSYDSVFFWSNNLNDVPDIGTNKVLPYMEQCGWSSERFTTCQKNEGYHLHLVCFFDDVMAAYHANQDYIYLRATYKPKEGQNDQSRDVWVLVNKNTSDILICGCNCEVYNETCKHCVAFLFFLARRTDNKTDVEKNELRVWKKFRNHIAPVRGFQARNESLGSDISLNSQSQQTMSLVISNVWGLAPAGSPQRRRKAIVEMLKSINPDVVLLQEFHWVGVKAKEWKDVGFPDQYVYGGHKEASILYDKNKLIVNISHNIETTGYIEEMESKMQLPEGKPPLERMCIGKIKSKRVPMAHFLCVSWHGFYTTKSKTVEVRKKDLKKLFLCIKEIGKQMKLPFIIAGDFNLSYEEVCDAIDKSTVHIYNYDPPTRKGADDIKDFFIASKTLPLTGVTAVEWKEVASENVNDIFDHNPVVAKLMTHASKPSVHGKSKATK